MKQKVLSAMALMTLVVVGLLLPAPASAEPTTRCKSVTVNLTDRADTGTGGHVWAKNAMTRTLTVCLDNEVHPTEGKRYYVATVVDKGTFTTQAGKTPRGEADLPAGVTGTVNGGYRVPKFTGPAELVLTAPAASTSTGAWVATAVQVSEGATIGSYRWAYDSGCEQYVDNNGAYTGDITGKCVTTKAPTLTEPKCGEAAQVVTPNVVGLLYKVNTPKDGKVVVTAKAKPGYVLAGEDRWVLNLPAVKACPTPTPSPSTSTTPPVATPTPTKTTSPTSGSPTASASPSDSLSPAAGVVGGSDGNGSGSLPLTGPKVLGMFGFGGLLVAVGGLMLLRLRNRRDQAPGMHRTDGDTQVFPAI